MDLPSAANPRQRTARDRIRRLAPGILDTDRRAPAALRALADYQPANPACTVAALTALEIAMTQARQTETQAEGAMAAARDRATAAEWALHNGVLDCKTQVAAQYGKDSEELQSLGLKRKSEYRRPPSRKPAAAK